MLTSLVNQNSPAEHGKKVSKQAEDWLATINRTTKGFYKCFKKYLSPYLLSLGKAFGNRRQTPNMLPSLQNF